MNEKSTQWSLNSREWIKGLKLAVLGSISGYMTNLFALPNFDFMNAFNDWHTILNGVIVAGGLYLIKTFTEAPKV